MIAHYEDTKSNPLFRATKQQLEEKREKGLCYNCDSKCTKGHKCAEKKLFYIEYEEEEENIKKHQRKMIYARTQPQRKKK